ncbi:uncharacterized protein LY89DRAFT_690736 [Mollisia scopiformis]|uniref:Uncharacterized protein n=1 Tax=Mollisia scopiformis TaxID=149040 RepID=A0A132B8G6_MOLSC|nr:uncharacterized protein LY89DRAFT_690736 [Mollisia scopiformis]KUJ08700.1 hypothetical protein LY89DRAFT_690736 [Mollisia scopiformis]
MDASLRQLPAETLPIPLAAITFLVNEVIVESGEPREGSRADEGLAPPGGVVYISAFQSCVLKILEIIFFFVGRVWEVKQDRCRDVLCVCMYDR